MRISRPGNAAVALTAALALSACNPEPTPEAPAEADPQNAFFDALASHCGKAYEGALASDDAVDADFADKAMVMHVRECSDDRIVVPFHVETAPGEWDRSRTWLVTRTDAGLRLKNDHRHEDGESDTVTMYGGDTASGEPGTARAQDFPVDAESIAIFEANDLAASVTNVWSVEVDPAGADDARFAYQLRRTKAAGAPEDRLFRVEFDLTKPVEPPPAPWGHK